MGTRFSEMLVRTYHTILCQNTEDHSMNLYDIQNRTVCTDGWLMQRKSWCQKWHYSWTQT